MDEVKEVHDASMHHETDDRIDTQPNKRMAFSKEPEYNPSSLDTLNQRSGARLCALLGITEDDKETKFPSGAVLLDVTTLGPDVYSSEVLRVVENFGGVQLNNVFGANDESHVQFIFPNQETAFFACRMINATRLGNFKFVMADLSDCYTTTHKGRLLAVGNKLMQIPSQRDITKPGHLNGLFPKEFKVPNTPITERVESITFSAENISSDSIEHAQQIRELKPIETEKCTLIRIKFALPHLADLAKKNLPMILDALDAVKGTEVCFDGDELRCIVGLGRSPGNVLQKLAPLQQTLTLEGMPTSLDFGSVEVRDIGGNLIFTTELLNKSRGSTPSLGGVFATDEFLEECAHPRDEALAGIRKGSKQGNLTRIDHITPRYFEIERGEKHVTICREEAISAIEENLNLAKQGKTVITVIQGPGGVGKTELARIASELAEESGVTNVYQYPLMENQTEQGRSVKKTITGIFSKIPSLKSEFLDLVYYVEGTPKRANPDAGVQARLYATSADALKVRFACFMESAIKAGLKQLELDDFQWSDDFSNDVYEYCIRELKKDLGFHLIPLARTDSGGLPPKIYRAINECHADNISYVDLKTLDEVEKEYLRSELTRYVRSRLPAQHRDDIIPPSFIDDLLEASGGLPVLFSNIMTGLLKNKIRYKEGRVVVSHNDVMEYKKGDVNGTVRAIMQERYSGLTKKAEEISEYLVVIGDVGFDSFTALLQGLGYSDEEVNNALDELQKNNIISLNPFGFLHDTLREYREGQIKDSGTLSKNAGNVYLRMKEMAASEPELFTPPMLFNMLRKILENPNKLKSDELKVLQKEFVEYSKASMDYLLSKNHNPQAMSVADNFTAHLPDGLDSLLKSVVFDIYVSATDAAIRVGNKQKAQLYFKKVEALNKEIGLEPGSDLWLKFWTIKLRFAYAMRDRQMLNEGLTDQELQSGIVNAKEKNMTYYSAYLELTVSTLRAQGHVDMVVDTERASLARFSIELARLKVSGTSAEVRKIESMILEIKRTALQRKVIIYLAQIKGVDDMTLFLRNLDADRRVMIGQFVEELEKTIKMYKNDQSLSLYPQQESGLYYNLARLEFLLGDKKKAAEISKDGIDLARRRGSFEEIVNFYKFLGDSGVASAIRSGVLDARTWDVKTLKESVENYNLGKSEILKEDPYNDFVSSCSVNNARAVAMLVIASAAQKSEETPLPTLRHLTLTAWENYLPNLLAFRGFVSQDQDEISTNEDYQNELATLELLLNAFERLGMSPPTIPGVIKMEEVSLAIQRFREMERRPSLTNTDRQRLQLELKPLHALFVKLSRTT